MIINNDNDNDNENENEDEDDNDNENENEDEDENENENEYKKINEDSASPGMVAGGAGLNIQHNERICNIRS